MRDESNWMNTNASEVLWRMQGVTRETSKHDMDIGEYFQRTEWYRSTLNKSSISGLVQLDQIELLLKGKLALNPIRSFDSQCDNGRHCNSRPTKTVVILPHSIDPLSVSSFVSRKRYDLTDWVRKATEFSRMFTYFFCPLRWIRSHGVVRLKSILDVSKDNETMTSAYQFLCLLLCSSNSSMSSFSPGKRGSMINENVFQS